MKWYKAEIFVQSVQPKHGLCTSHKLCVTLNKKHLERRMPQRWSTCHLRSSSGELGREALWAKAEARTGQLLLISVVEPPHRLHPPSGTSPATELPSQVPPTRPTLVPIISHSLQIAAPHHQQTHPRFATVLSISHTASPSETLHLPHTVPTRKEHQLAFRSREPLKFSVNFTGETSTIHSRVSLGSSETLYQPHTKTPTGISEEFATIVSSNSTSHPGTATCPCRLERSTNWHRNLENIVPVYLPHIGTIFNGAWRWRPHVHAVFNVAPTGFQSGVTSHLKSWVAEATAHTTSNTPELHFSLPVAALSKQINQHTTG